MPGGNKFHSRLLSRHGRRSKTKRGRKPRQTSSGQLPEVSGSGQSRSPCPSLVSEVPSISSLDNKSASERKLSLNESLDMKRECNDEAPQYTIVSTQCLQELLTAVICKVCQSGILSIQKNNNTGLSSTLVLTCEFCGEKTVSRTSTKLEDNTEEIDRRIIVAMRAIGSGRADIETFSRYMNLESEISKRAFKEHMDALHGNLEDQKKDFLAGQMLIVRDVYRQMNLFPDENGILDLIVSYDGTWHRRGHQSNYGIGFVIEVFTGLVIDYEVLSKYCQGCTRGSENHVCWKNYTGSSGGMEQEGALKMWARSLSLHNVRYTQVVCDGDTKTITELNKQDLYNGTVIVKDECVNHVSKRMYAALERVKADSRAMDKAKKKKVPTATLR